MVKNRKRKPRKELPTVVAAILAILFVGVFVLYGICVGFLVSSIINGLDILPHAFITFIVLIVYMIILTILMFNSDCENIQPLKWYINNYLISFTLNLIVTAVTVFGIGADYDIDINYIVGFGMFPLIGIITTPNIIKYVVKDTSKWKHILYDNGNLHKYKGPKEFYKLDTPVAFEKKLLAAVYKNQFLNILVVVAIMVIIVAVFVSYASHDHSYTNSFIRNLSIYRARKASGFMFFLTLFIVSFAIPIMGFYIANAVKKIRVVKNHQYLAYHAIVSGVHNGNMAIYSDKLYYKYKYCTCFGIKEKNVHQTPVTLIFIPDDVFLFPDNEKYKA